MRVCCGLTNHLELAKRPDLYAGPVVVGEWEQHVIAASEETLQFGVLPDMPLRQAANRASAWRPDLFQREWRRPARGPAVSYRSKTRVLSSLRSPRVSFLLMKSSWNVSTFLDCARLARWRRSARASSRAS